MFIIPLAHDIHYMRSRKLAVYEPNLNAHPYRLKISPDPEIVRRTRWDRFKERAVPKLQKAGRAIAGVELIDWCTALFASVAIASFAYGGVGCYQARKLEEHPEYAKMSHYSHMAMELDIKEWPIKRLKQPDGRKMVFVSTGSCMDKAGQAKTSLENFALTVREDQVAEKIMVAAGSLDRFEAAKDCAVVSDKSFSRTKKMIETIKSDLWEESKAHEDMLPMNLNEIRDKQMLVLAGFAMAIMAIATWLCSLPDRIARQSKG